MWSMILLMSRLPGGHSKSELRLVASRSTHIEITLCQGWHRLCAVGWNQPVTHHSPMSSHQQPLSCSLYSTASQWSWFQSCRSSCVEQSPGRHSQFRYTAHLQKETQKLLYNWAMTNFCISDCFQLYVVGQFYAVSFIVIIRHYLPIRSIMI